MAIITRIDVKIITGDRPGAETAGCVYLGIGGREFCLATAGNDFARNSRQTFTLGEGANINHADDNDPRAPYALHTEELANFPVYIRFAPNDQNDQWNLESVEVHVNPARGAGERDYDALHGAEHLWLSPWSGLYCYLHGGV
ncbi:MAG: hypothetical protein DYG89_02500 [Caldilinea sp. CFX5]|nr:hypothetical protein [Caldilinea sp. CFX5]